MTNRIRRSYDMHSTAYLRKELHNPKTNRWMRCDIYAELLARKQRRNKK